MNGIRLINSDFSKVLLRLLTFRAYICIGNFLQNVAKVVRSKSLAGGFFGNTSKCPLGNKAGDQLSSHAIKNVFRTFRSCSLYVKVSANYCKNLTQTENIYNALKNKRLA